MSRSVVERAQDATVRFISFCAFLMGFQKMRGLVAARYLLAGLPGSEGPP